jgi:hypothetical protein
MMRYEVGQVLFVILSKKSQVYPMMVVEEITKKTLQGENVNYVLRGGADPTSTVLLNQVDGEIFESAEEAKKTLISRATSQIERLVLNAVTKSKEWYSKSAIQETIVHELPEVTDVPTIVLSDGTIARVKMPSLAG